MYLDEIEIKILAALVDRRYRAVTEIAEQVGSHQQIISSRLKMMGRYRLVERGGWGESWGHNWGRYRITPAGRHELDNRNQLRLVV